MNLNLTVVYSNLMVSISNDIMCFEGGVVEVSRSGTVKGKMTTESLSAVAWLQDFCNSYAEKLPNESKLNLPPCLTKQYVYGLYLEKATNPVSKSHFYKLWKRELPNVTIPKRSRFSKCDKCTLIKEHLATCREKHQRETLIKMREKHLKQQNDERKKYYKHASKAKDNPEKYLSMIIDAMDQNKTYLPHFLYNGKFLSNMWKLRLNLMGVIVHGIGIHKHYHTLWHLILISFLYNVTSFESFHGHNKIPPY